MLSADTVFTRPALMSAHIVVLPTPTSLQAAFTETVSGFMPSRVSFEIAVLQMHIASLLYCLLSVDGDYGDMSGNSAGLTSGPVETHPRTTPTPSRKYRGD